MLDVNSLQLARWNVLGINCRTFTIFTAIVSIGVYVSWFLIKLSKKISSKDFNRKEFLTLSAMVQFRGNLQILGKSLFLCRETVEKNVSKNTKSGRFYSKAELFLPQNFAFMRISSSWFYWCFCIDPKGWILLNVSPTFQHNPSKCHFSYSC